jgi:hypothetical protein
MFLGARDGFELGPVQAGTLDRAGCPAVHGASICRSHTWTSVERERHLRPSCAFVGMPVCAGPVQITTEPGGNLRDAMATIPQQSYSSTPPALPRAPFREEEPTLTESAGAD